MAARASLANLFAEGPHPDLSSPNNIALYRAFQLCQNALNRQYSIWGGVAWLCNALVSDSAALDVQPTPDRLGPVSIHPRDRGFIKRARLDDDARSKIIRHTTSVDVGPAQLETPRPSMAESVGFSISGVEGQVDGAHGLLELYQPGVAAEADTVSWLTEDYHFELNDPSVQVRLALPIGLLAKLTLGLIGLSR